MTGFSAKLDALEDSSKHLGKAADAAGRAYKKISGSSVPTWDPDATQKGPLGIDIPAAVPDSAFGTTLGLPGVAIAYEQHREKIADLLGELHRNTVYTSEALKRVAELYEQYDHDVSSQMAKATRRLDEI